MNAIVGNSSVWSRTGGIMTSTTGVMPELGQSTADGNLKWAGMVRRILEQLLELGHNWDGRGSGRVLPDTALFALQLLTQTMPPVGFAPAIVALGNGALQLEWHTPAADLEIEVRKPNSVSIWYSKRDSGEEEEFDVTTDFGRLEGLVKSVANG